MLGLPADRLLALLLLSTLARLPRSLVCSPSFVVDPATGEAKRQFADLPEEEQAAAYVHSDCSLSALPCLPSSSVPAFVLFVSLPSRLHVVSCRVLQDQEARQELLAEGGVTLHASSQSRPSRSWISMLML